MPVSNCIDYAKHTDYFLTQINHAMSSAEKGKIFIGHGHSSLWRELKDFLEDRLGLHCDEFNREPTAGLSTKERLVQMLDDACFAFLVMTAEEEHSDGTKHARGNVIHEVGLFQGRLSFEKSIILLEDGCAEFSNITGLTQIRFPSGNLAACFEEVRRVLEREGIPGTGEEQTGKAVRDARTPQNSSGEISIELTNPEFRYLMTLSRPRNQQGVPAGFFDHFANREQEAYQAMLEKFVELGLMRFAGPAYVISKRGYDFADQIWRIFVLHGVASLQAGQWDYVHTETIADTVLLTDGEPEARELSRHLAELAQRGYLELVNADIGIAAARMTPQGHAQLRPYAQMDFSPVE